MSRTLNVALNVLSVALLLAGAVLVVSIFVPKFWVPSPTLEAGSPEVSQVSDNSPKPNEQAADPPESANSGGAPDVAPDSPEAVGSPGENAEERAQAPEDKTLMVSIPKMDRVDKDSVPNTAGDDQSALKENVAIHLEGTGYPWQKEANVYLAGHRLGYPGTDSFLGFYGLDKLEKGDKIKVSDADGERYTYKVYRQEVVRPSNMSVTEPIAGRNILTLQTCTLPNYTQRLIVQAEKVA